MMCSYRFRSFRGTPRDWILRIRFKKFKVGTLVNATTCAGGWMQVRILIFQLLALINVKAKMKSSFYLRKKGALKLLKFSNFKKVESENSWSRKVCKTIDLARTLSLNISTYCSVGIFVPLVTNKSSLYNVLKWHGNLFWTIFENQEDPISHLSFYRRLCSCNDPASHVSSFS